MPRAISAAGFGSSRTIADKIGSMESPTKARRPVTISYSTAPKLKMSVRASSFFPSACSGDMYDDGPDNHALTVLGASATVSGGIEFAGPGPLGQLGQAEIQHLHAAVPVDHDVARLQVAMHDARRVRRR